MNYFLRSLALAHLALAAFWALALRCSAVWERTRALPPRLPSATAAGFFRFTGYVYHEHSSMNAKRFGSRSKWSNCRY